MTRTSARRKIGDRSCVRRLCNIQTLGEIDANDREIEYINGRALPTGAARLLAAELVARDIWGWRMISTEVIRITRDLCLPAAPRFVATLLRDVGVTSCTPQCASLDDSQSSSFSVNIDPTIMFDQVAFEAMMGANTFPRQYGLG